MTLTVWGDHPDPQLAEAIGRFEEEFSYPLGDDGGFRIEHGGDGWRFFHALGEAAYIVATTRGGVQAVVGAALRRVVAPDGTTIPVLYLGDLKIAARARGGRLLLDLVRAISTRFSGRVSSAFCVVMDGTTSIPPHYTGRLGIPAFTPVGAVTIMWLRTASGEHASTGTDGISSCGQDRGLAWFMDLAAGQYCLIDGTPGERSLMPPAWLCADDGSACGRLEDTLRAKRLRATTGEDMRSAHVSCFAYRTVAAGARLLQTAAARAAEAGYPMLFVAVAVSDVVAMSQLLGPRLRSSSPATVFGTGLPEPGRWNINTAEI